MNNSVKQNIGLRPHFVPVANSTYRIEKVQFDDGTVWTHAELQQAPILPTVAGAVTASADSDIIDLRNAVNNAMNGGTGTTGASNGNDTYLFGIGSGQDSIYDFDGTVGAIDTLKIIGVAPSGVTLGRTVSGAATTYDLVLKINGTTDQLTIVNYFASSIFKIEKVQFDDGTVWTASTLEASVYIGAASNDTLTGTEQGDTLLGLDGNDTLNGNGGNDLLQGGLGSDILNGGTGNNLLDGGAGVDTLTGNTGNELFIGGTGNDTLTTGSGADLIAFNRGDGLDTINASTVADNTLSLGGGIQLTDLVFHKDGNNLLLDTGASEGIILKDWYVNSANHSILTLQMIEEAAADFNPAGGDALRDNKIETFNFQGLADRFDQAVAANPGLTSWALTQALTDFYLTGSDSAALGGDLAYQYGKNGNLANVGLTAAQSILSDPAFGTGAQTLKPLVGLQEGMGRLG